MWKGGLLGKDAALLPNTVTSTSNFPLKDDQDQIHHGFVQIKEKKITYIFILSYFISLKRKKKSNQEKITYQGNYVTSQINFWFTIAANF